MIMNQIQTVVNMCFFLFLQYLKFIIDADIG